MISERVRSWIEWITKERGVDLGESLVQPPYTREAADIVDVVFEGKAGSRLWRDWMVSFTSDLTKALPELEAEGFVDLVGGEVRALSLRGPT